MNKIYLGDNIEWLNEIQDESIDMCYIDPPFFTQRQLIDNKTKISFNDKFESSKVYIEWMRPRIELIYKKLKKTGSIFLHCDWHASHRLRCLLDDVFGEKNIINEIIWFYSGAAPQKKSFAKKHDTIFFYAKNINNYIFNSDSIRIPYEGTGGYQNSNGIVNNGKLYKANPLGKIPEDVWKIPIIHPNDIKERVGYPTQKPEKLLERIIQCSTKEGDIVLDCFGGSGTTAFVAKKLNRNFITGDISQQAVDIITKRLKGE